MQLSQSGEEGQTSILNVTDVVKPEAQPGRIPQPGSGCGPDEAHAESLGDLKDGHHNIPAKAPASTFLMRFSWILISTREAGKFLGTVTGHCKRIPAGAKRIWIGTIMQPDPLVSEDASCPIGIQFATNHSATGLYP
ncbi:hypothetical protein EYF80_007482 [Liparis tanakae]|uniref:Uncharacterized protein n=1 Tax=Liparis tanakae TaxID=230148 RepID=A0A4Z2IX82_9TELE|nr:hypothetical protein EYF80_007482 [Liparis tanakae]